MLSELDATSDAEDETAAEPEGWNGDLDAPINCLETLRQVASCVTKNAPEVIKILASKPQRIGQG